MRSPGLLKRFLITLTAMALGTAAWNVYVVLNDDGTISGRVVDGAGNPVEGAKVTLSERSLLVARPRGQTVTDAEGQFAFTGHRLHRLYLEASKEGAGRGSQREYRLYFKGQNLELEEPLQLGAGGAT